MNPFDDLNPGESWRTYEPDARHPWDRRRAARLLRRAGIGPTSTEIDAAVQAGPAAAVQSLLDAREPESLAAEMRDLIVAALAANDAKQLAAAWLLRMQRSPAQATELLTLFWHGHFATSAAKVTDPRLMYAQHELLRRHAFGPFDGLTLAMARDPAMLIYLDSATNRRTRPNENFAREIMELFCLGLGNYTERDIQELARCFTGWEVHQGKFHFYAAQHDRGEKAFLGRRGAFGGEEGVGVVLDQPAAARFLARKLVQLYVCDEPSPPDAVIQPLADELRESKWQLRPVVRRILTSRLLLADPLADRKIQGPVQLAISWIRALDIRTNTQALVADLTSLGQALYYPPNVKGWPGGRAWLNSATIVGRANLLSRLAGEAAARGTLTALADRAGWNDDERLVDGFGTLLLARSLDEGTVREARERMASGGSDRAQRIAQLLRYFALLPDVHLA